MSRKKEIPWGVQAALFNLTRRCYAPDCPRPVVQIIDGVPVVTAEMAHICGEKPGSARYGEDPGLFDPQDFSNIILRCPGHDKLIDRSPKSKQYTVANLRKWKQDREGDYAGELNGLGAVTETKLQDLILLSIESIKDDIFSAINTLRSTGSTVAELLESLVQESLGRRFTSGDIEMLHMAASRLAHLEDTGPLLYEAALRMGNLEDSADLLFRASHNLSEVGDISRRLSNATYDIPWSQVQEFSQKVEVLERLDLSSNRTETTLHINDLVERIGSTLDHMSEGGTTTVSWPATSSDWKRIRQGMCAGLGLAMVFAITVAVIVTNWGAA